MFFGLSLPLPLLPGPMAICLIAALGGADLKGMGQVGIFFRTLLGVAVGSTITLDIVSRLPEIGASLLFAPFVLTALWQLDLTRPPGCQRGSWTLGGLC